MTLLHYGMVGGGIGSFIGNAHRRGAQMDDMAVLSAGCFSRNNERNLQTGNAWHIDSERLYSNWAEMAEAESKREDGIDFVVIATSNNTHYAIAKCFLEHGIHVSCDKPVSMNLEEALELKSLAQKKGLHFGVSYTYVNYPLVHQIREMVDAGEIGNIINVFAEYPQDWVINGIDAGEDVRNAWRFDTAQAGASAATADIGTHLSCLIERGTGLKIKKVLARMSRIPEYMPLDTNTQVMLELSNGAPGLMWASQISIGHECSISLRVYGDKGSLFWTHDAPNRLRFVRANGPEEWLTAGRSFLAPQVQQLTRIAAGHPEGFYEAFACYYRGFCQQILKMRGEFNSSVVPHPTIDDGIESMRFIAACVDSQKNGNVWTELDTYSIDALKC